MISTIYGDLSLPIYGDEDLIASFLESYGEWAYAEALIASTLVSDGEVLWDIGAHLGTFSLGVANNALLERIVAVEANPEVAEHLQANLADHLNVPFEAVLAGVSALSGFGSILLGDPSNRGSARFLLTEGDLNPNASAIPSVTLKGLRATYGDYDFLKLDIEGMEIDAIKGDLKFIRQCKPVIWAECNETQKSFDLLELMQSLGYALCYVAFPSMRSDNFRGSNESLFPMAYEAALVAATPDRLKRLSTAAVSDLCIVRIIKDKNDLKLALWDTPRWARPEWVELSRPELIARIGRLERGQRFESFIDSPIKELSVDYSAPDVGLVTPKTGASGLAQIFWVAKDDREKGFAENSSQTVTLTVDGNRHLVRFSLPVERGALRLRIDPLDRLAVVTLMAMSITTPSGGSVWQWNCTIASLHDISGIVAVPEDNVLHLICVNGDPQFEVDVPDDIFAHGYKSLTLEIELSVLSLEQSLPQLVQKALASQSTYLQRHNTNTVLMSTGFSHQFVDIAQLMKEQIMRRNATIATQRDELESLKARQSELESHVLRAEAQLDVLKEFVLSSFGKLNERI